MTQNKFWLVMDCMLGLSGDSEIFRYFTFEEALKSAKEKTFSKRKEYTIFEATHNFKADINVKVVTSFEGTPEESLAVEHEFKLGDGVKIKDGLFPLIKKLLIFREHTKCSQRDIQIG